jgi:NAD(P)-dependent dehydrogenase (short-subunit alcohol dehydrogenase family)
MPVTSVGRTALITGGGRGLGRAFALGLAATGMAVAVVARTEDELAETVRQVEAAGGCAEAFRADVSVPHDVAETVKAVERRFGRIDLLVNNAGVAGPIGPTWQTDAETWWSCLEVNLHGAFLCCQAVLPGMLARGHGRIINVASAAGEVAVPYMSAYNASKTAVIRFTETLAAELRERGIPVFAITPGPVRTAMTEELIATAEESVGCRGASGSSKTGRTSASNRRRRSWCSGARDHLSGKLLSATGRPADLARLIKRFQRDDLYTLQLRRPETFRKVLVESIKDRLRPVKRSLESLISTGSRQG